METTFDIKEGRIRSNPRFHGQPAHVPYFFSLALEGWSWTLFEKDGHSIESIEVSEEDRDLFPGLGDKEKVNLHISPEGRVCEIDRARGG